MNPSGVPASEVLNVFMSLGNPTKKELLSALESQGLLNDGVKSLVKGSKDLLGDLGKMGDNPIEKSYHHMSDFFSPGNAEFFTEKVLPGAIGFKGISDMQGHMNETFNSEKYEKLYKDLESPPNQMPAGMSHFMGDKLEESGPYDRTKWASSSRRKKIASIDQDMAKLLPSGYSTKNIMAQFESPAFQAMSPNQKLAFVDNTLKKLTRDLNPLIKYLRQMGFNVYDES